MFKGFYLTLLRVHSWQCSGNHVGLGNHVLLAGGSILHIPCAQHVLELLNSLWPRESDFFLFFFYSP